jgi:hypothetical protein
MARTVLLEVLLAGGGELDGNKLVAVFGQSHAMLFGAIGFRGLTHGSRSGR